MPWKRKRSIFGTTGRVNKNIPGSSSGRTKDSDSFNGGSNPSPGVFNCKNIRKKDENHPGAALLNIILFLVLTPI